MQYCVTNILNIFKLWKISEQIQRVIIVIWITANIVIQTPKRINIALKMPTIYTLSGFKEYEFRDKILYRKAYKTKSATCKWQYRAERKISPAPTASSRI